ncbi:MAG: hypothetical protein Ta2A_26670 [Treponemataceae bacterium]|nr:MAG: hypothetical protein Ta2A_26670 [Treponemataceae bacterium]
MERMTEEEAWALDAEISNDENIEFGANGTGFLSMRDARLMGLNDISVKYLMTKAEAARKSPGQIVNELIQQTISQAAMF